MKKSFFLEQNEASRKLYIDLLEVTAALSNMFADSKNPFLYYRAMENIFCKSFQADNLSRSDVSVDASKNGLGIGLKTFLQNNGNSFQKVAEFNKDSYLFKGLEGIGLIKKVAFMRNERIKSTMRICNLSDMIYHLITRSENYMAIFEEHMDLIDKLFEKYSIKQIAMTLIIISVIVLIIVAFLIVKTISDANKYQEEQQKNINVSNTENPVMDDITKKVNERFNLEY